MQFIKHNIQTSSPIASRLAAENSYRLACADHNAVYKLSIDNNYTLDALSSSSSMFLSSSTTHSQSSILIFYDHRINLFHNLQVFPPLTHSKQFRRQRSKRQQQHETFERLTKTTTNIFLNCLKLYTL